MKWKFIDSLAGQLGTLLAALGLPSNLRSTIGQEAIIAEYLRDCIYRLVAYEQTVEEGNRAVHTLKIVHILNQQLGAVWPQSRLSQLQRLSKEETEESPLSNDSIKRRLDSLQLLGDVECIGKGFWLPAPLRLVQVPGREEIAVIGGDPIQRAQALMKKPITREGLGRLAEASSILREVEDKLELWQTYEQWIGWRPENLAVWTQEQIARALKEGANVLPTFENYEIFSSFPLRGGLRGSWLRVGEVGNEVLDNRVLLCRTRDKTTTYFLGVFKKGQIVKECPINNKDVLAWLRLGLRTVHGKKSVLRWDGEKFRVFLPLPRALEKHVLLYAYKVKRGNDTFYYSTDRNRLEIEDFLKQYGYYIPSK